MNAKLFESGKIFFHVFSFAFECVSIGRFSEFSDTRYPVFRRVSGGGVVFHRPQSDVNFAFSFFFDYNMKVKDIFELISSRLSNFIGSKFHSNLFFKGGEIYFSNGDKICGMAAARRRNFFIIEGSILMQKKFDNSGKSTRKGFCFQNFGERLENFYEFSYDLLEFMSENFKDLSY